MPTRKALPEHLEKDIIPVDSEQTITYKFIATILGVSEQVAKNMPIPEQHPSYFPAVVHLIPMLKAILKRKDDEYTKLRDKLNVSRAQATDYTQQLKKEQTKTAQIKNAQLLGQVINAEEVEKYFLSLTQQFINAVEDFPARVSSQIVGIPTRDEAFAILKESIATMRHTLAEITIKNFENIPIEISSNAEAPPGYVHDPETDSFIRENPPIIGAKDAE